MRAWCGPQCARLHSLDVTGHWGAHGEAARRTLGRVCPDLDHRTASRSRNPNSETYRQQAVAKFSPSKRLPLVQDHSWRQRSTDCREGDALIVTKLDRLARSARHLSELVDQLEIKGVALRILDFSGSAVDTRGATGRLMLNMFAAMAQFEREMMFERQREGIARVRRKESTKAENLLLGRRLKMPFAFLGRGPKSRTSRPSWGSVAGVCTAHLKARCRPKEVQLSAKLTGGTAGKPDQHIKSLLGDILANPRGCGRRVRRLQGNLPSAGDEQGHRGVRNLVISRGRCAASLTRPRRCTGLETMLCHYSHARPLSPDRHRAAMQLGGDPPHRR